MYTSIELYNIYKNYLADKDYESDIDTLTEKEIKEFIKHNLIEEDIIKYNV